MDKCNWQYADSGGHHFPSKPTLFKNLKNRPIMKTILNLSIALMLIFGSAGAVNFYKMYKSGEIETLYSHEQPAKAHAAGPTAHICKPTPPLAPLPLFDRIE